MPGSSIQSFFTSSPTKNNDGFTTEEMQFTLQSANASTPSQWTPTLDYEEADLGTLIPGPRNLALTGRVVNFHNVSKPSKQHKSAQGYLKITFADDTGVLTVRLWYANTIYAVRLGQLVTVWTVHVSLSSEHNSLAPSTAPLFTSVFPENERHCYVMLHENSDTGTMCKRPFGCGGEEVMEGLMTLKGFVEGGYDVEAGKVLVCVKSVGARKRYMNRNGTTSTLLSLAIFDSTADASFTLYNDLCASAASFVPYKTILLISSPGWRIEKTAKLTLNSNSRLDIDPDMGDAHRLRALVRRLTKKEHVNPPFPDVDVSAFEEASVRALYTLADVDDFARSNPKEKVVGYLSVVLTQLDIVTPFKRNMLMCNECCGVPVFANDVSVECKQCEQMVSLRINPRILGPVIDETGQISSGKLILSDAAWEQLLGRTAEQLIKTEFEVLRYLEQRLLLLRITMGFTVCLEEGIGRLGVWCVKN